MSLKSKLLSIALAATIPAFLTTASPAESIDMTLEMTPDQTAVMSVITAMTTAFHNGDIDSIMTTYEPDVAIAFQPGEPSIGHAAARENFAAALGVSPHFSYGKHEVIVTGDIALHITPWTMTGKLPDGTEIGDTGLSVAVLRKQSDGTWKMVIDNPYGSNVTK